MRYQGGKSRIAKPISEIINRYGGGVSFVSLFCGTCAIESLVTGYDRIICNDKHEYLIALLKAVQDGWEPPGVVSEEEYYYVMQHKDEDKALAGFVGFGCSFGGAWDGGYARACKTERNFASEAKRGLEKKFKTLMDAEFLCLDYRDVELPNKCVVYADPPYANARRFSGVEPFNTTDFWEYMRKISTDHIVFISEQSAPDDFVSIWEKEVTRTMDSNKDNYFKATEKLFIHKSVKDRGAY